MDALSNGTTRNSFDDIMEQDWGWGRRGVIIIYIKDTQLYSSKKVDLEKVQKSVPLDSKGSCSHSHSHNVIMESASVKLGTCNHAILEYPLDCYNKNIGDVQDAVATGLP